MTQPQTKRLRLRQAAILDQLARGSKVLMDG
jgi:hypothetical protein